MKHLGNGDYSISIITAGSQLVVGTKMSLNPFANSSSYSFIDNHTYELSLFTFC